MKSTVLIIVLFSVVFNLYSFNDTYLGISYGRLVSTGQFSEHAWGGESGGGGKGYSFEISYRKSITKYFAYRIGVCHSHISISPEAKANKWLPVHIENNYNDPAYALYEGYNSYSLFISPILSFSSTGIYLELPFHAGYSNFGDVKFIHSGVTNTYLHESDPVIEICLAAGIGNRIALNDDLSIGFGAYYYFPNLGEYKACLNHNGEGHVVRWETRRNFFKFVASVYFKLN